MEGMEKLSSHLKTRIIELRKAKNEGNKIVGYMPGGYLPEEIVLASGAIPLGLLGGANHSVVELASQYICHWIVHQNTSHRIISKLRYLLTKWQHVRFSYYIYLHITFYSAVKKTKSIIDKKILIHDILGLPNKPTII